jgi:hypothetical protein
MTWRNMSGEHFPLLSPRSKRYLLTTLSLQRPVRQGQAVLGRRHDVLLRRGGQGTVPTAQDFAAIGVYIIILPDKKYLNRGQRGHMKPWRRLATPSFSGLNDCYAVGGSAPYDLYYWDERTWTFLMAEFGSLESAYTGPLLSRTGRYSGRLRPRTLYTPPAWHGAAILRPATP